MQQVGTLTISVHVHNLFANQKWAFLFKARLNSVVLVYAFRSMRCVQSASQTLTYSMFSFSFIICSYIDKFRVNFSSLLRNLGRLLLLALAGCAFSF